MLKYADGHVKMELGGDLHLAEGDNRRTTSEKGEKYFGLLSCVKVFFHVESYSVKKKGLALLSLLGWHASYRNHFV